MLTLTLRLWNIHQCIYQGQITVTGKKLKNLRTVTVTEKNNNFNLSLTGKKIKMLN